MAIDKRMWMLILIVAAIVVILLAVLLSGGPKTLAQGRPLNCYEWSGYPTESECRSSCFAPKWCEFSDPGCWQCMTPYDIR